MCAVGRQIASLHKHHVVGPVPHQRVARTMTDKNQLANRPLTFDSRRGGESMCDRITGKDPHHGLRVLYAAIEHRVHEF